MPYLVNGDLVAGTSWVHDSRHAVGEEVEAAPGELDAGEGEHPGELARHVHLETTASTAPARHVWLDCVWTAG